MLHQDYDSATAVSTAVVATADPAAAAATAGKASSGLMHSTSALSAALVQAVGASGLSAVALERRIARAMAMLGGQIFDPFATYWQSTYSTARQVNMLGTFVLFGKSAGAPATTLQRTVDAGASSVEVDNGYWVGNHWRIGNEIAVSSTAERRVPNLSNSDGPDATQDDPWKVSARLVSSRTDLLYAICGRSADPR